MTKVDKGKQVVSDKKFVFKGTCFDCGKDGHWAFESPIDKQKLVVQEDQRGNFWCWFGFTWGWRISFDEKDHVG